MMAVGLFPTKANGQSAAGPPNPGASVTDQSTLAKEEATIEQLHGAYDAAQSLLGAQHVLISPALFAGKRCADGNNVFSCSTVESRGGIAGLVLVPLFGAGGGHGADWWPAIETDDVADGFYRFDKNFRRLRDVVANKLELPDAQKESDQVLAKRFNLLAGVFESLLKRIQGNAGDGYYHSEADQLKACLDAISRAPVLPRQAVPAQPPNLDPQQYCAAGARAGTTPQGWTALDKLKLLDGLWREYDLLVDATPPARHVFLIGPLAGLSITDKFGDLLYGAGLELGWKDSIRFTLSGGLRSSMRGSVNSGNFDTVGWWAGLGLSGQIGDQLINSILGAQQLLGAPSSASSGAK
jgi:hypothetical protein